MRRKEELVVDEVYHIFNKSIADFKIFNSDIEFIRMKDMLVYYQVANLPQKFSLFMKLERNKGKDFKDCFSLALQQKEKLVQIIAYCLMPTHLHLVLKQLKENGISVFIGNILNSYARYFNTKHKRKGPLWEGKFKNVLVKTNEQFLHLTRYIHLNPVSAFLVDDPHDWKFSSYREYINLVKTKEKICDFSNYFNLDASSYEQFVNERIDYQRELERIKHLILE